MPIRRNPATRQPGNPATRQPGNPATRQPGNPATRQPGNPVAGLTAGGEDPGHDVGHTAPGHPQQHRHHAQCRMADQPRTGVLKRRGKPRPRPCPGHRGDHHPMLRTAHPTRRGLEEHPGGPQVQTPPPPRLGTGVIARTPPPAP
jgi:hypothetical protein